MNAQRLPRRAHPEPLGTAAPGEDYYRVVPVAPEAPGGEVLWQIVHGPESEPYDLPGGGRDGAEALCYLMNEAHMQACARVLAGSPAGASAAYEQYRVAQGDKGAGQIIVGEAGEPWGCPGDAEGLKALCESLNYAAAHACERTLNEYVR